MGVLAPQRNYGVYGFLLAIETVQFLNIDLEKAEEVHKLEDLFCTSWPLSVTKSNYRLLLFINCSR